MREQLVENPDELAGAVAEGGIVSPALGAFQIVVFPEGLVVLHHVVRRIDQRIAKNSGAALGHSGFPGCKLAGLPDRGIKASESQELAVVGETVDVANLPEDHSGLNISDARNGHNDGAHGLDSLLDPGFVIINLPIQ